MATETSFLAAFQHTASLVLKHNGGRVSHRRFIFLNLDCRTQAEICFLQTSHLKMPPSGPPTSMGDLTAPRCPHPPITSSAAEQHPHQGGFSTPGSYVALLHASKTLTAAGREMALCCILAALVSVSHAQTARRDL